MSKEDIVNRIIADAEAEAADILKSASSRADDIISAAEKRALMERGEAEAEAGERAKRISDGRAAAARLDSAKILLAEKRRVIEEIYARALKKLQTLGEKESVALMERLLKDNAEEGDEIVFAQSFGYAARVLKLDVVAAKKLGVSKERADISGGCLLRGRKSDKDLSYEALLRADMEEHQAEMAAKLFAAGTKKD